MHFCYSVQCVWSFLNENATKPEYLMHLCYTSYNVYLDTQNYFPSGCIIHSLPTPESDWAANLHLGQNVSHQGYVMFLKSLMSLKMLEQNKRKRGVLPEAPSNELFKKRCRESLL